MTLRGGEGLWEGGGVEVGGILDGGGGVEVELGVEEVVVVDEVLELLEKLLEEEESGGIPDLETEGTGIYPESEWDGLLEELEDGSS